MKNKKKKDEAYNIRKIYEQMELDLIASMKRNLSNHEKEESRVGFKFEQWQVAKLRDLEIFRRANKKIIGEYSKEVEELINNTLVDTYKNSYNNVNNTVKKIGSKYIEKVSINLPDDVDSALDDNVVDEDSVKEAIEKILEDTKIWEQLPVNVEESFFRLNDKKLDALMETVENDFKQANASVLRRMDDIYRQTIFKAQVYYNTGNITLDQAIDMATKDFLGKGIDSITYADGKKVNIASYAEMALRTANHRAYLMGEGKKRQEMGLHLVVVSAHATSCKLCVPWQGLILIDDVYSGGKKEDGPYPLLSEAMEEGLLHPNCRHNLSTYFQGITTMPKVPDNNKALDNYKREQGQRALERAIRKQKRIVQGTIDEDNLKVEKKKLRQLQANMREYLKDNPQLRRAYRREKIY